MVWHSSPIIGMSRNLICWHGLYVIAQGLEKVAFVPPPSMWIYQIQYWFQHINTSFFDGKVV